MGALIVAHENVRKRMSVEQFMEAFGRRVPPSPPAALPVVTFNDTVTFHLNGEEIRAFHVAPAHTDGDTVIHFKNKNVIHMGDVFFNGIYPFIDVSAGGSIEGMIEAVGQVLKIAQDETIIIPGHGPLANRSDLQNYHKMLSGVRDQVKPLVQGGKSVEEAVQAKPTKDFDEKWGKGFMNSDNFVKIVYDSLKKNPR
jgi:cyclase